MGTIEFVTLLIAAVANVIALVATFIGADWTVLIAPIAEGITIIAVAILGYFGIKARAATRVL